MLPIIAFAAVTLAWDAPPLCSPQPCRNPTGYSVYRSTVPGGPYSLVAALGNVLTYTDNPAPGTYYWVARSTDSQGESLNSNQVTKVVAAPPMQAGFSCTPLTGAPPLSVSCTDQSGGWPSAWNWNFGEGAGSSLQNPTKIYNLSGPKNVTLTASASAAKTKPSFISVIGPQSMAAPTFVSGNETSWATTTTPKTTASFNVNNGDTLVAFSMSGDDNSTLGISSSPSLTWTQQVIQDVTGNCELRMWTAVAASTTSMTVSFSNTGDVMLFGGNVLVFRDTDGIGAVASSTNTVGTPTLDITTTQANSSIVVANGDWGAIDGASRTWRTNAGALTEHTYFRDAANYTVYGGRHADAGSIGTYAVGLTAPAGQLYTIGAIEVKGTSGVAILPPFKNRFQVVEAR